MTEAIGLVMAYGRVKDRFVKIGQYLYNRYVIC